jgi:hypothetical protein
MWGENCEMTISPSFLDEMRTLFLIGKNKKENGKITTPLAHDAHFLLTPLGLLPVLLLA